MGFIRTLLTSLWPSREPLPLPVHAEAPDRVRTDPSVPLAPTPGPPAAATSVEHGDELQDALDAAFESLSILGDDTGPGQSEHPDDAIAARDLFAEIAGHHWRPVKNFIFELKRGTTTKEWIEISRPVLSSILSAAESIAIPEVSRCLEDLDESLAMAQQDERHDVSGESRELILSIYEELAQLLPDAFAVGEEGHRREAIIMHSLLRQVPGIGYVTLCKLYEAGLASLDALFLATPSEMCDTTGVSLTLCQRICDKIQEHRSRSESTSPEQLREGDRRRLAQLVSEMRRHHETFKTACEADHPDESIAAQKRNSRSKRQACALEINVMLAEMGEVGMVEQLEKLAFEQRVLQLEEHLAQHAAGTKG
jgi:hypothetical protein